MTNDFEVEPIANVSEQSSEYLNFEDATGEARQLAADLGSAELEQVYALLSASREPGARSLANLDSAIDILSTNAELKAAVAASADAAGIEARLNRVLMAAMRERANRQLEANVSPDAAGVAARPQRTTDGLIGDSPARIAAAREALEHVADATATNPDLADVDPNANVVSKFFQPGAGEAPRVFSKGFDADVQRAEASKLQARVEQALASRDADGDVPFTVGQLLGEDSVPEVGQLLAFKTGRVLEPRYLSRMSVRTLARYLEITLPPHIEAALPPDDEAPSDTEQALPRAA